MIPEATDIGALAMQSYRMAVFLLFAWAFTLGPALCLLRGRNAGDLMFKVTLYTLSVSLGTRLCSIWYLTLCTTAEPLGYLVQHGFDGFQVRLHRPVLLIMWFCGGIAGHALIYSVSMLPQFWTTVRNRVAVVFYSCALLVGLFHPVPAIHFWGNWNEMVVRAAQPQLEANRALTDSRTRQWVSEHPEDLVTVLARANFLDELRCHAEALAWYRKALQLLPDERGACRAGIENKIEETRFLLATGCAHPIGFHPEETDHEEEKTGQPQVPSGNNGVLRF